jgi:hypothetical protein
LVKDGIPYINLRIKTLPSLAHEIIDLDLARASIKYLSETSTLIIIEDLFNQIRQKKASYFYNMEPKEGMADALGEAIRDLRMCGIHASLCCEYQGEEPPCCQHIPRQSIKKLLGTVRSAS